MAERTLRLKNFAGGLSDDDTFGAKYSFSEGEAIDSRQSPGFVTLHRRLRKESIDENDNNLITTEIHDAARVDANGGDVYLAGGTKIYKRSPGSNGAAGTYTTSSQNPALRNVQDLDYRPDIDALFLIDNTSIHELSPITTGATYSYDKYRELTINALSGTGGAFNLQTAIDEDDRWSFVLEKEPIYSATFKVSTVGTGSWTVTVHDGANRLLASKEITVIPPVGSTIEFIFAAPIRAKIGATYHIHVTSSDGTGAVETSASNTLATADGSLKSSRLVDTGEFGHAAIQLGAKSYYCNEKYIAEWEMLDVTDNASAGYNPHKLVAPSEVIYIGAAIWSEYTVFAGALKRSTDALNDEPTEGILSFWKSEDDFFSFNISVPQGVPYSIYSINNVIYFEAKGVWYRWAGGDIEPVFQFPGVDMFTAAEGGPQNDTYLRAGRRVIAANQDNTLMIGYPYASANANIKVGIYSWGNAKGFMPPAINYNGLISTGNGTPQFDTSTTPDTPITGITLVKRFGNNLLVAWKDIIEDVVVYGVDYLNDTSPAATRGVFGSLWFDDGSGDKEKTPRALKIVFREPLPEGCTVTPYIQRDRNSTREEGSVVSTGARELVHALQPEDRWYDILFGAILTSSEGNFPRIKQLGLKFVNNKEESNDTEVERDYQTS